MSDQRLFLVYDAAFDDMDAEGCPAFGYVLLFNEQDVEEYNSGENPPFPAVSLLFTDHADGSISGDLLGWAQLDHEVFRTFPLGYFFMLMEQAAQVAINAYRQVGQVPDKLIAQNMPEDDLIQFDVQFGELQLSDSEAELQLAQQMMSGRPYLDS
ncbi:hypothetical protein [Rheinheimera sp.]|uniref:hypothetical protein n=1 Tax=Rheinheimera sp. TaxID=1869214 RepID=UPI0027B95310|nr:hypothetical protein [Rheinheimera sp.]